MKKKKRKKTRKEDNNILGHRVNEKNFLGALIDQENKTIHVYTNDMLIKRCKREAPRVARSFDKLCKDEIPVLSLNFSRCAQRIGDGFHRAVDDNDEMAIESGQLLMNALKTIEASYELLRNGYILQPAMLLRSVIEVFCLIAYFNIQEGGFNEFKTNKKFDINKTVWHGKQLIEPLGQFQGMLSNNFVHISELHSAFNIVEEYKEMTDPLKMNLDFLRISIWITYIVSELAFIKHFEEHEFWNRVEEYKYELNPTKDMDKWLGLELKEQINNA